MRFREIVKEHKKNLLEIDFNRKDVINQALNAAIICGFEAETVWKVPDESSPLEDISNIPWSEVEHTFSDEASARIDEAYAEWIVDHVVDKVMEELLQLRISKYENNVLYMKDFIATYALRNNLDSYINKMVKDFPKEYENRELDDWIVEFIETEYQDEFLGYLYEFFRDSTDLYDVAFDNAIKNNSKDTWIESAFSGNWLRMLDYLNINTRHLQERTGFGHIAELLKSTFNQHVKTGKYKEHAGNAQPTFWRVEEDSSIIPHGEYTLAAEIVSPVYSSPAEMISAIRQLFKLFEENDVATNKSTGFHVTMSMQGVIPENKPNAVKMALLLGDKYVLEQFNRLDNMFTASQMKRLEKAALNLASSPDPSIDSLGKIEQFLNKHISKDKYNSIHFKNEINDDGNLLVEFRMAGNDYLANPKKIEKVIVRYSATLLAGHDKNAYKKEYARAIAKLVSKAKDSTHKEFENLPKTPLTRAVQTFVRMFSSIHTIEMLEILGSIYPQNKEDDTNEV